MVGKRHDQSHLKPFFSHGHGAIVAGSGTDNQEVTGATIDRRGFDGLLVLIARDAVLAGSQTLSTTVTIQESDDNISWADAAAAYQPTVPNLQDGGDESDVVGLDISLLGLKQYVRVQTLANLSAGATDTAQVVVTGVLGGAHELPPTQDETVIRLPA
jgi:hypothetical protein